jgi:Nuclease-related domain
LVLVLLLVAAAFGCAVRCCSWIRLAGRSRIGARSEDEVRRALAKLEREGWRLRHSLRWAGRGDIDSLAIAPTGIGFVIETKTSRFDPEHVERTAEMAGWLRSHRQSWFPNGALPVMCVVRARRVQQTRAGVLVVSLDQLVMALRIAAGARSQPLFLSPSPVARRPTIGSGSPSRRSACSRTCVSDQDRVCSLIVASARRSVSERCSASSSRICSPVCGVWKVRIAAIRCERVA